MNIQEKII